MTCAFTVEAIGRNSNLGHHCKKWADLRRRILGSPPRPASGGTRPRSKRILGATDVDDIVKKYDSGETTQQIGAHFGISKSRVATVLREQGITICRQGLTEEQVKEAVTFLRCGSIAEVDRCSRQRFAYDRRHGVAAARDSASSETRLDLDLSPPRHTRRQPPHCLPTALSTIQQARAFSQVADAVSRAFVHRL